MSTFLFLLFLTSEGNAANACLPVGGGVFQQPDLFFIVPD
jgi:hypothetical protein